MGVLLHSGPVIRPFHIGFDLLGHRIKLVLMLSFGWIQMFSNQPHNVIYI